MEKLKLLLIAISLLLQFRAFAQVQVDHAIQLTGTGANAKVSGIHSVTDSADAASAAVIQNGRLIYAMASGSSNAFVVNLTPPISAYDTGMVINFISNQTVTGPATLNVNNLGAIPITKYVNQYLTGCEIYTGQVVSVVYDGTNFQMMSVIFPGQEPGVPVATAGTGASSTQMTANWDSAENATGYYLDAATDSEFLNPVAGFTNFYVGDVFTYNITGLSCSNTYYYQVHASNNCGQSGNSNIISYSTQIPTIISTTPGTSSSPGAVILGATASAGTINWYAAATGGSSLDTGTSFITPSICVNTTYYVSATSNGCTTSSRTSVTATISKSFQIDNSCSLTSGLISYYKLENTIDSWGTNNLTTHNSVVFDSGKIGLAADGGSTNGSPNNNFLNTGNSMGIDGGAISIALWVNVNTTPSSTQCLAAQANASSSRTGYQINYDGTQLIWDRVRLGVIDQEFTYAIILTPGVWYHLVLTYDDTNIEGWFDGVSEGTLPASGNGSSVTVNDFSILDYPTQPSGWAASSKVDEVGLWNRKLSNQEISDLYNSGIGQTMQ